MAKDEKRLLEMARRQRKPPPARIQNAPELLPGLDFYYEAFSRLTTDRNSSGYVGPIGYSAISRYCRDEQIEGELREDVFYHIERMDKAYLDWQAKKTEQAANAPH